MALVPVISNSSSSEVLTIDLSNERWRSLRRENLGSFRVEELIRECRPYKDGIFPGCIKTSENKQIFEVANFCNWLTFSQVMEEDTILVNGKKKLTTRYYDQRKIGWSSPTNLTKEGTVIGYCVNGDIYHKEDREKAYEILYKNGYLMLVQSLPAYIQLKEYVTNKQNFLLTGDDPDFLKRLANLLTSSN